MVSFSYQKSDRPEYRGHGAWMASIKTIAQLAGTSVTTVSRVMNNSGYVSNELRANVERAIATTNYRQHGCAFVAQRQKRFGWHFIAQP